jgi:hypothetical protein
MLSSDPAHIAAQETMRNARISKDELNRMTDKFANDVIKFSFDPDYIAEQTIVFGKVLTDIPIYEYQHRSAFRIIKALLTLEGGILTFLFSRQSGKTEVMAFTVDTMCVMAPIFAKLFPELDQYKDGIHIGLFAPQSDQVVTTYSRCLSRLKSDNAQLVLEDPDIDTELNSESRLILDNGSYLKGQVAAKTSKIESKTYHWVIMEEAQDIDDFLAQKSIEPMVSATNGLICKVGTTGTRKNHFWYDIQTNKRNSRKASDPKFADHHEYNYKEVIKFKRKQFDVDGKIFHLNYEKDVLRKRERWGEDSDAFRLGFALQWALDSGMFITDADWDRIINKKKGFKFEADKDSWNVGGLDIGKMQNPTVLTVGKSWLRDEMDDAYTKEVYRWFEWLGEDYDSLHYLIVNAVLDYDLDVLALDYTGVGKAVGDRLISELGEYVQIIPYTFSKQSKSDLWQNLQGDIRHSRIVIPANKQTQHTQEYIKCERELKGLLKWWDGSYLVAQKGDSADDADDYPDSLALFAWAGNVRVEKDMEESSSNELFGQTLKGRNLIEQNRW